MMDTISVCEANTLKASQKASSFHDTVLEVENHRSPAKRARRDSPNEMYAGRFMIMDFANLDKA